MAGGDDRKKLSWREIDQRREKGTRRDEPRPSTQSQSSQKSYRTAALAERLATGPTQAYGKIKRLLRESLDRTLPAQLDAERAAFHQSMKTTDFAEGIDAFLAKRKPTYTGA